MWLSRANSVELRFTDTILRFAGEFIFYKRLQLGNEKTPVRAFNCFY